MRRAVAAAVAPLAAALVLAGCTALPTAGPVRTADPQIPAGYSVDVLAEGPVADASAQAIVEGFLRASAYGFSDDFSVARQFLAPTIRETWDPTAQLRVYSAAKNPSFARGTDGGVTVTIDQVAVLDASGRYAETRPTPATSGFTLVRGDDDQWRIAVLADGLLISDLNFQQTFSWIPLYFLTTDNASLVPDTRWYPYEGRAAAIVRGLLEGPSGWLAPAIATAFPEGTILGTGGVAVQDGIAVVDLSRAALTATEEQRSLMLTQLHATLSSITEVTSVRITVNGARLDAGVPARELAVPTSVSSPVMISDGALARWNGREVVLVDGAEGLAELEPSDPAVPYEGVDAPTVALSGGDRLITVPTPGIPSVVLYEGADLAPPSIDRHGWIWTTPALNGGSLVAVTGYGASTEVSAPWLTGREADHVRVAADGARVLVVSRLGDATRIELAAVLRDRTGMPTVLGEPILIGESLTDVTDVTWVDQSTVAVLGSVLAEPDDRVHLVTIGGTTTALQLVEDAVSLTSNQNARSIVVATADGRVFVRNGIGWREVAQSVSDPAYSG
ncbi:MAG: LpqB family beta-propeller domain-containing protein [Actinomycetota bacterium]